MSSVGLRDIYEVELGRVVSDRTWDRAVSLLELQSCGLVERRIRVKTLASMRRQSPYVKFTVDHVKRRVLVEQLEINGKMEGRAIASEILKRQRVTLRTVRRWGKSLGIPLQLNESYEGDRLRAWLELLSDRVCVG